MPPKMTKHNPTKFDNMEAVGKSLYLQNKLQNSANEANPPPPMQPN